MGSELSAKIVDMKRKLTFNKIPKWNKFVPNANYHNFKNSITGNGEKKVVYFPSCISRTMGVSKNFSGESQTVEMMELLKKCGYDVIFPQNLNELCCGMPFSSKGFVKQGNKKTEELLNELLKSSDNGAIPILFDTSPCTYHVTEYLNSSKFFNGKIKIYDTVEFLHDFILPDTELQKSSEPVAVHITCSSKKMGLDLKFLEVAEACSDNVIIPEEVNCCGFAGDRGFTHPELNESALVNLKKQLPGSCVNGYSNSKTCEIGLSDKSGIDYQSIIYLVNKSIKEN
jgi:D-lactate dehydrogenase